MKTIEFFEREFGGCGMEGKEHCTVKYETYEQAVNAAKENMTDDYNDIYKVVMIFNGEITEERTHLGCIKTAGYYYRIKCSYDYCIKDLNETNWNKEIEKVKNNKKMKDENKEKRIAEIIHRKADREKSIKEYAEILAENK